MLIQDLDGHPPDPTDAGLWVDQYDIAWPVLADRKETWAQQYLSQVDDPLTVWLIGREGEILYREVGETYTSAGRTKKAVGAALAAEAP